MERNEIVKIIKRVISKNNIKKAYLFGSFAREEKKYHDVDIAIDPPRGFTLLDLSRVANMIEEQAGVHVDLVTLRSLNPKIKRSIENEMVAL
jgi:predicted nucleotidyltransferase